MQTPSSILTLLKHPAYNEPKRWPQSRDYKMIAILQLRVYYSEKKGKLYTSIKFAA